MGITLTDYLLFGAAKIGDIDDLSVQIFRRKVLQWGAIATAVDVVVRGVPPIVLPEAVANGIHYINAYGGLLQGGVPSGYTAVEYIESTGTQYIDTGIPTQDGIGFDVTFLTNSTIGNSGDYGCILGGRKASGNNDVQITTFGNPAGNIRYGSQTGNNAGIVNNQKLHVSLINRVVTLDDGTTYTVSSYTFKESNNIYLFGLNNNGTLAQTGSGCRIYNAKLYANSNVVADFIPVKRNSDSVLGMYDAVSGKFFTNAGTGTFTAGNEIAPTPSNPVDLVCNNGALKVLDKTQWTIFTNPTSLPGQGVFISSAGKWTTIDDSSAGVAIPLTIGKQYTLTIHQKTAALGTTLRFGQSPQETPTSEGVQLTDWYRGTIADGQMISFVAKLPYLVMQFSAVAVEAGMIQEAIEVLEAQGGDYTFLEYIEATGTQYINTGYYTKANTTIKAKLYTNETGNKNWFGGTGVFNDSKSFVFNSYSTTQVEYIKGVSGWKRVSANNVVDTPFILEFTPTYIKINEQKICDLTVHNTTDDKTLWLFGRNGGTAYMPGRVYYFEIWEDNNLIQNLIPVRRISDNVVGMYDTVSGTFFENQGTGTFVAGPVIGDGEVLKLTPSNDTAGVANLFAVNTYKDVQEIITGTVKHKVNVYILNGEETAWNDVVSSSSYAMPKTALGSDSNVLPNKSTDVICSHYSVAATESGTGVQDIIWVGGSNVNFKTKSTYATLQDWKDFLAAQYAAGTPVIVIVPFATEYTEPEPIAQTMNVVAGDNTLDIVQAGMSGLEVEVKYTTGVAVTITEVENAQLDDNITVTIS